MEKLLVHQVRPALSSHAGSVRLRTVDQAEVVLEFVGSCAGCYFRKGCVESLVVPTFEDEFGTNLRVRVRNAR
ncbi:NifU family protein [Jiangella muralis]|uniref:NifU family protein n=1 Tax=Jiangella muralis TaxID=702383 RepID=UPI0014707473|nr:NifU family protein [Jiangella muralis]